MRPRFLGLNFLLCCDIIQPLREFWLQAETRGSRRLSWMISLVVERFLHTEEVVGSIPISSNLLFLDARKEKQRKRD